jgi:chemotaxis protein methyltransferase CheR
MFGWFKKTPPPPKEHVPAAQSVQAYGNVRMLAEYFQAITGVSFEAQHSVLRSKLVTFCKQHAICSFETCLARTKEEPLLRQKLIDHLTTNETYFFREARQIEELVARVKEQGSKVRILCAPCATGEEPYSIAIALLEAGVAASEFHIVGIDINTEAIAKAAHALYGEGKLKNVSSELKARYFTPEALKQALSLEVMACVTLQRANVFDSDFKNLGRFDYIFSRNMLIYFDKPTKEKAKKILESMRKDSATPVFFGHADLF